MILKLKYFGMIAEAIGKNEESLEFHRLVEEVLELNNPGL